MSKGFGTNGCILEKSSTSEACEGCEKISFLPLGGRLASSARQSLVSTDVFSVGGDVRTPSTAGENKQVIYWILSDSPQKACPSQSSDSRRCRRSLQPLRMMWQNETVMSWGGGGWLLLNDKRVRNTCRVMSAFVLKVWSVTSPTHLWVWWRDPLKNKSFA